VQIYPAVDIQDRRVARGPASFPPDPVACARRFQEAGAQWIHVADLDRAYGTGRDNGETLREMARLGGVKVQAGGLLRAAVDVRETLSVGATRAVAAAAMPHEDLAAVVRAFGAERIALGIDVREGTIFGTDVEATGPAVHHVLRRAGELGVRTVVYRNLTKDGRLEGADLVGAARLVPLCDEVLLAGGVASREEILAARSAGLAGLIVGRALLEGRFTLEDAIAWAR
jgi:phosphoribosylformimino-5-aminoimidazole carboxamide ribonucleotide (ProFAR) isomerase